MNDQITLDTPIEISHVAGVEGPSVYIHGFRVAGAKPWGGGSTVKTWVTTPRDIINALVGRPATERVDPEEYSDVADWHTEHRRREAEAFRPLLDDLCGRSLPWGGRVVGSTK